MKAKVFIEKSLNRVVSSFTVNRNGNVVAYHKWDDMYESVLSGRTNRRRPQK